jgi:hypothetical protein
LYIKKYGKNSKSKMQSLQVSALRAAYDAPPLHPQPQKLEGGGVDLHKMQSHNNRSQ